MRAPRRGGAAAEIASVESGPHDDRSDGSLIALTSGLTETAAYGVSTKRVLAEELHKGVCNF
jgi:hypothetical protein